ncbi:hypothetical protein O6H91_13G099700 [Diphasiastrum complanatum]|nr:hypothetical protein O6H91_13G097600 [Diphasiastrum complanatum]KAJ7534562.1 hypothetical protein O6H91_13G099700 [Diphasiastrum complanatum]
MAIVKSLEHLCSLGALTDEGKLSDPVGVQISHLPLEPLFAKAMLMSPSFKCSEEMLAAVAMLSVNRSFLLHRINLKRQIQGYVQGIGLELLSCEEDYSSFRRCLAASFFLIAACKQPDGTFRALASGQTVSIHPSLL